MQFLKYWFKNLFRIKIYMFIKKLILGNNPYWRLFLNFSTFSIPPALGASCKNDTADQWSSCEEVCSFTFYTAISERARWDRKKKRRGLESCFPCTSYPSLLCWLRTSLPHLHGMVFQPVMFYSLAFSGRVLSSMHSLGAYSVPCIPHVGLT